MVEVREWFVICTWLLYKAAAFVYTAVENIFLPGITQEIMDLAKIAKNLVKCVTTGESVSLESLWKDKACVMIFLRRFG